MNWYEEILAREELRGIARKALRKSMRKTGRKAMSMDEVREWIRRFIQKAARR
jgi:hypothetical protein